MPSAVRTQGSTAPPPPPLLPLVATTEADGAVATATEALALEAWPTLFDTTTLYTPSSVLLALDFAYTAWFAPGRSMPSFLHWKARLLPAAETLKVNPTP